MEDSRGLRPPEEQCPRQVPGHRKTCSSAFRRERDSAPSRLAKAPRLTMEHLKTGAHLSGDCGNQDAVAPAWFDRHKYERAREIFREHIFSFFFAHLVGLAMVVTRNSILDPLVYTGHSNSLASLYRRYLSTLRHVKSWYEGDIWKPGDPAHTSISKVRQMHRHVAGQLEGRTCPVTNARYLSQLDMAITQFAFMGLSVLYPRQLGLFLAERDLECVIHFWRTVGYKLGIADCYNLCSGNYEETFQICFEMQETLIKPALVNPSPQGATMSKNIICAVRVLVIFLSYEGMMAFWARQIGLNFNATLSLYDWWSYSLIWFTFNVLLRYNYWRGMFNWLLRLAIRRGTKFGGYFQKQLELQEITSKALRLSYAYRYQ